MRNGDWIGTFTGKCFYLLDPRPEDVCIEDIAHALSQICRFNGHTKAPYDVASHSCNVQDIVRQWGCGSEVQLYALLHDAHEAYTGDMSRPYKNCLSGAARQEIDEINANIQRAIYRRLGLVDPSMEIRLVVKDADNYALALEAREHMVGTDDWNLVETKPGDRLVYTKPGRVAEATFIAKFDELMRAVKRR